MGSINGTSMTQPTPLGSPEILVPSTNPNRGQQLVVLAWGQWKQFMGTVLQQSIDDLQSLPPG